MSVRSTIKFSYRTKAGKTFSHTWQIGHFAKVLYNAMVDHGLEPDKDQFFLNHRSVNTLAISNGMFFYLQNLMDCRKKAKDKTAVLNILVPVTDEPELRMVGVNGDHGVRVDTVTYTISGTPRAGTYRGVPTEL